jgi:hypothetical protein
MSGAKEMISQARSYVSKLALALASPRPVQRTPGQDSPVVPFWVIPLLALVTTPIFLVLLASAFANVTEPGFLDASPACSGAKKGFMARAPMWLVVAVAMSSGLSSVNPVQSGLILAF